MAWLATQDANESPAGTMTELLPLTVRRDSPSQPEQPTPTPPRCSIDGAPGRAVGAVCGLGTVGAWAAALA
jgi:hypothetical protein